MVEYALPEGTGKRQEFYKANKNKMKSFVQEWFEYNHHFNQKLSEVFGNNSDKTSEKSVKLFNHMLNAHHIWNHRMNARTPAYNVWELHPNKELAIIDSANYEYTIQILETVGLNHTVHYSNSKGEAFSNKIRDILFHVINHSTYHRAQIATEFKQVGLEPLASDYILYKR